MKIIVLHNIISPIRNYLFEEMQLFFNKNNIQFKVIFLSASDKNRDWKNNKLTYCHKILKNFAIRVGKKDLFTFFINPTIVKELEKENPDIIICFGWDHLSSYFANYWSRKNNKVFILWSGSTEYEKSWRRMLFTPLVKYLVKHTDYFISYGTRSKHYLIRLGADHRLIHIFYNAIDNVFFTTASRKLSHEKDNIKRKLGISTKHIILFSGQLIERKGIYDLIEGFRLYSETDSNVSLLIIGSGKERKKIENIISKNSISNVKIIGFVQYDNLPQYYSIADMLVLPSHEEVWGLTINEAMASGLPVITTYATGAAPDLIISGKNGYIIKTQRPRSIVSAIRKIYNNKLDISNNSLQIIQKTNIQEEIKRLWEWIV